MRCVRGITYSLVNCFIINDGRPSCPGALLFNWEITVYTQFSVNAMYSRNCDVLNHDIRKKVRSYLCAESYPCTSIIIWNNIVNNIYIAVLFPQFQ